MGPPPMNGWGILLLLLRSEHFGPFQKRRTAKSCTFYPRGKSPSSRSATFFSRARHTCLKKPPFPRKQEKNRLQHRGNVRSSNAEAPFSWPFDHRAYGTWLLSFFLRAGGSQTGDKRPTPPPPPPQFFQGKEATDLFYAPASYVEGKEEKH